MKKINNKGFTLVEVLAVVAILGMLTTVTVIAYTKYISSTKVKSCDMLAKSASDAASNYYMTHATSTSSVSFDTLVEEKYLENAANPYNKNGSCTGKVIITRDTSGNLNINSYEVKLCCSKYYYTYVFPGGTKTKNSSCEAN